MTPSPHRTRPPGSPRAAPGPRRRPRHRRVHRPRLDLRLPPDPRGADRRHPRPVPRAPGRRHRPGSSSSSSAPRCSRPPASWLGRLAGGTLGRWIAGVGIAAATVQVVGLQRWVTLVPGISDDALDPARTRRRRAPLRAAAHRARHGHRRDPRLRPHRDLHRPGRHRPAPHRAAPLARASSGYVAAGLIATGVVDPARSTRASLTNFAGYVAWCVWLIAVAVALFRVDATGGSDVHVPARTSSTTARPR